MAIGKSASDNICPGENPGRVFGVSRPLFGFGLE